MPYCDFVHAPQAFDVVFAEHYDELVDWCRKRVDLSQAEPEELVHLAYLRCRRTWRAERRSVHGEMSYFCRCLRWIASDVARQNRRRRRRDCEFQTRSRIDEKGGPLRMLAAMESLESLSPLQHRVCIGVLEGKSLRQLQCDLNLSQAAISVHLCRAHSAFRRELNN